MLSPCRRRWPLLPKRSARFCLQTVPNPVQLQQAALICCRSDAAPHSARDPAKSSLAALGYRCWPACKRRSTVGARSEHVVEPTQPVTRARVRALTIAAPTDRQALCGGRSGSSRFWRFSSFFSFSALSSLVALSSLFFLSLSLSLSLCGRLSALASLLVLLGPYWGDHLP